VCLANPHDQTTVPSATGDEMPCLKSEYEAKKRALGVPDDEHGQTFNHEEL
jgi:hypothetical protein